MSDIRNINPNKYNNKGQAIILRKITHPNEVKLNRSLMIIVLALMSVIILMGFLLIPDSNRLLQASEAKRNSAELYTVSMNPAVSVEINMLKAQLVGLISGSIESKLRILENSIRTGVISSTDMGTIQDLKNDLKVLKTYSETGAGRLIAQPELELSNNKNQGAVLANEQLLVEISQLKSLIYISIASCGLMLAAVGGVWIKSRYHHLEYEDDSDNQPRRDQGKDD